MWKYVIVNDGSNHVIIYNPLIIKQIILPWVPASKQIILFLNEMLIEHIFSIRFVTVCCFFSFVELSEDKSLAIGQNAEDGAAITAEDDQTTFDVKYLGSTPVDSPAGAVVEAVKTILAIVSNFSNLKSCVRPKAWNALVHCLSGHGRSSRTFVLGLR